MSVAVIGAGITGLTAAFRLRRAGVPVTVYEASDRTGGVIQSARADGFLAESGPNTLLETSPVIGDLVRDLGLESKKLYSNPAAKNRYVVRGGKPVPVPDSPAGMLTSKLFSTSAKFRLLTEPFVRRAAPDIEESVAQFVLRRLGREFLDYAINPMIAGIYAGDPARLSITQAFPKLYALEQRYGSLILGQVLGARERARSKEVSKQTAPKFSFPDGLQTITDALHYELRDVVRLRSSVKAIRQRPNGWNLDVTCGGSETTFEHEAVLLAGTAHKLAEIRLETNPALSLAPLGEIHYAPVASLVLGFRREDVEHTLDGFGILVPEVERLNILGVIFSSSLFPDRAPAGHVTLTCYVGGLRAPALATRDTKSIVELALGDLRTLLGVCGRPIFVHHSVYPKAIPQYEVGFGRFRDLMNNLETNAPGLFLAGHYRDGISLSDSIISGANAAGQIGKHVASRSAGLRPGSVTRREHAGSETGAPNEFAPVRP
jgi:oxygen-dependent protoporphyrinogen oxidase